MTENEKFLNKMRKRQRKKILARIAKLYAPKHLVSTGIVAVMANTLPNQKRFASLVNSYNAMEKSFTRYKNIVKKNSRAWW